MVYIMDMSKQISIRISDEEYSQLGGGNVSREIKRRCFNNAGGDIGEVNNRLDKLAILMKEISKKLDRPVPTVPAPDYGNFWDSKHDPLANKKPLSVGDDDSKYGDIIERVGSSFERDLDYDERGKLMRDVKSMGLVYNQYKKTLEILESGKYRVIKQY